METDTGQISAESTLKELYAYAKLLFLRNGRQFKDKTSYREFEGEVSLDESGRDWHIPNNARVIDARSRAYYRRQNQ
jgi:hypothetical protein